jgi:hypothetical protein
VFAKKSDPLESLPNHLKGTIETTPVWPVDPHEGKKDNAIDVEPYHIEKKRPHN